MDIDDLLLAWQEDEEFTRNTTCWNIAPTKAAEFAPFPSGLPSELEQNLRAQGINALYSHQAEACRLIESGQHIVIATGTASGKTLCYNLPVLQALLQDPSARALYLFPTKALAQDQLKNVRALDSQVHAAIYDGDTPTQQRPEIRKNATVLITNPDMLHQGILP
ncbi:MAG TPA: DEAD/DEAH box helicase, partial [Anaerolineaceae bacterium]|nr:DEAD/DEAH box helicase [Anaerolineaceae bacterium]